MGRVGGVGWMRRMDGGKVEEEIDRKVTWVAVRSFFVWGLGIVGWALVFDFF